MTDEGIAKSAARLRWAVFAAIAVMALLYLVARFAPELGPVHIEYRHKGVSPLAGRLVGDGTVLLLLVALLRLAQMLRLIALGELFSVEVVRRFRGFAFWLLLMALYGFLAPIVLGLALPAPGGARRIVFVLDLRELLTLGITLLLFLLARLLERAREIEAEMREIV